MAIDAEERAGSTAMVAGASGLVGRMLVEALTSDDRWRRIVALGRRALPGALPGSGGRVSAEIVDFARLRDDPPRVYGSERVVAFCALGTTMKAAGSQAAFRAVDFDAVVAFAGHARRSGARGFVLVSSVGADPGARNFYLRVKGETEQAIGAVGFDAVTILRPSLLLGARGDARTGEALAQRVLPVTAPLLIGPLRRYRPIDARTVAAAMAAAGLDETPGTRVWEHDAIAAHARGLPG